MKEEDFSLTNSDMLRHHVGGELACGKEYTTKFPK
jgi:hypothetical protein